MTHKKKPASDKQAEIETQLDKDIAEAEAVAEPAEDGGYKLVAGACITSPHGMLKGPCKLDSDKVSGGKEALDSLINAGIVVRT